MVQDIDTIENITDHIYQHVKAMSLVTAREVLNFINFLQFKQTYIASSSANNTDLINFIQESPKGNREAADIDKEFQALRDEWGQP